MRKDGRTNPEGECRAIAQSERRLPVIQRNRLLFCILLLATATATLQGPARRLYALSAAVGSFSPAGQMQVARYLHTATLLRDGKVLICGGIEKSEVGRQQAFRPSISAELYDPTDGHFTPVGFMATARVGHTATLLSDGRILLAGGDTGNSVEIYDPRHGVFTLDGKLRNRCSRRQAFLLNGDKILLIGGELAELPPQDLQVCPTEIFDPALGRSQITSFVPPYGAGIAWLDGSRVLVAGGCIEDPVQRTIAKRLDSALVYTPSTDAITRVAPMAHPRCYMMAIRMKNGKVMAAGGDQASTPGSLDAAFSRRIPAAAAPVSVEIFDPATGSFSPGGSVASLRGQAVALDDGRVFFVGDVWLSSAEIYDPFAKTFLLAANLPQPWVLSAVTLLSDGSVLITGGHTYFQVTNSAEIYRP
jgi:large repetitive protein